MIRVMQGDITEVEAEAIVNPSNSYGFMGGGVALAIRRKGGKVIEEEAVAKAPIAVGSAVATTAGRLKARYVIHASTMEEPAQKIGVENVALATKAALKLASEMKIRTIAFPGMGTGVGGVPLEKAAEAMLREIRNHREEFPEEIILVALDRQLYNAFREAVAFYYPDESL